MSRILISLSLAASLVAGTAQAETPRVVADIAPVHALVARVMQGTGVSPALIVDPGASPHEYSLRPSQAEALAAADLVFWISPDLTPWMESAIETLADGADVTTLLETEGTIELELRETALFGEDDHGHDHGHSHGHDHGDHDPHAWLSPANAANWTGIIADRLAAADPAQAGIYQANAAAAQAEIAALTAEIDSLLAPKRGGRFVVFHDAYQYFETSFDIPAMGAIALSDASDPGPARIAEIQAMIRAEGIDCVLAEPQFNPGLVATVTEGATAKTAILDPLGATLTPGPALYPDLMRGLARALAECL